MKDKKIRYTENPFTEKAVKQTVEGYRLIKGTNDNSLVVVDNNSGGISRLTGFYQKIKVDKTHFIKLYAEGVQALLGLHPSGRKVFSIIYKILFDDDMYGKDRVILSYDSLTASEKETISIATWYRGIKDLIAADVLAATTVDSVFWLNPSFIYRGDRLAYCKEYVMEQAEKAKAIDAKAKELKEAEEKERGKKFLRLSSPPWERGEDNAEGIDGTETQSKDC